MEPYEISEINTIKKWADDIRNRVGRSQFSVELDNTYAIPDYNLYICTFKVDSSVSSRDVKRIIREEADKFRDGRLYFMAYNDLKGIMILLFYSFFLDSQEEVDVKELSPIL